MQSPCHELTAIPDADTRLFRSRLDQPSADGGHGSSALGRTGGGNQAVHRAERAAHGRTQRWVARRKCTLRGARDAPVDAGDPSPGEGDAGCQLDGGHRVALRRVLRSRTSMTAGSAQMKMVRRRKFPRAAWSSSTSPTPRRRRWRRLSTAAVAFYNVVDDDPAAEWLPVCGRRSVQEAHRVPRRRLLAGEAGGDDDRDSRRVERQGHELRRRPAHPSWPQGFAAP